jgi:hypothetical protein
LYSPNIHNSQILPSPKRGASQNTIPKPEPERGYLIFLIPQQAISQKEILRDAQLIAYERTPAGLEAGRRFQFAG